jgi:4-alpha-glucanotransferase
VTIAADSGAQTIALNPLHQLHLDDPENASPYSPLSRLHLNALYIDVDAAAAYLEIPIRTNGAIESLRASALVDYSGVAGEKIPAMRMLYDAFLAFDPSDPRARAFHNFQALGGDALRNMAVYETLASEFHSGWMHWPSAFRDPRSHDVAAYARAHKRDVEFYAFLQWIADAQLAEAGERSATLGIGLYRDLAVGVDANSVDVWSDRDAYCAGIAVGAPPDPLNTAGQNWGLPPFNPRALRERAYAPFITMLRANMRHAGALRIDHVMGLMRLFCIPHGAPASDGAYVQFPFEDLIGVVALESRRNRCMIVGEDLGTVPPGFRERMAASRIFGCRLFYFEREEGGAYRDPSEYPHDAVASTGTHDLSPLAGYGDGLSDVDRAEFLNILGDLPDDASDLDVVAAAYRALARTGAGLLLLQMEDALVQHEPVNVPGTTTEHPNWRRKLSVPLEQLQHDVRFTTIVEVLREARSGRMSRR